jgi:squalene cyclase
MVAGKPAGEGVPVNAKNTNPLAITLDDNINGGILSIQKGVGALLSIIPEFLEKGIELERLSRIVVLLSETGLNQNNSILQYLVKRCISEQNKDGGWLGVVDTMWCASFLEICTRDSKPVESALTWLINQKHDDGSWGKSTRDIGRIPVTGPMLYFLPQLASESSLLWLEKEWSREFKHNPKLTYKGAFTLMAFKKNNYQPVDKQLVSKTIKWLETQQNDDMGWGPWKPHSVGSDPWCTGITMVGLLQYPDYISKKVIQNGVEWLKIKQLPNGLWPYHYIEKGSSWALYALALGYSYLHGEIG